MIRVFIVASSPSARAGLQNLLANRTIKVVGAGVSLESVVDELADGEVDIVLVDASGESAEQFRAAFSDSGLARDVPFVLLADEAFAEKSAAAFRAGFRAILPSDLPAEQLLAAVQAVIAGFMVMHPAAVAAAFPAAATPDAQDIAELVEPLTRREREVLQMLASGLGNKEIAARLNISDHTAKFHVASILGKLGAASRTEAVAIGIRRGLVLL